MFIQIRFSFKYKEQLIKDFESKILKHFESKKIAPIIDQVFDLEDIQHAHARMESNQNIGKILLKVFDDNVKNNDKVNTEL